MFRVQIGKAIHSALQCITQKEKDTAVKSFRASARVRLCCILESHINLLNIIDKWKLKLSSGVKSMGIFI